MQQWIRNRLSLLCIVDQACTQGPGFCPGGTTCSRRGPQITRGPPCNQAPTWLPGAQETGDPWMTAGHWVIRGPLGNQWHMNETFISVCLVSKHSIQCLKQIFRGPEGPWPCASSPLQCPKICWFGWEMTPNGE